MLPWILALVAVPLEMLLDSMRHVLSSLAVLFLESLGHALRVVGHTAVALTGMLGSLYDVYIGIPLRIERAMRSRPEPGSRDPEGKRGTLPGVGPSRGEVTAS